MASQVILHIGTHRTGSTSLQRFLSEHRDGVLRESGYRYPVGMVDPESHIELGLASLRPERLEEVAPFSDWLLRQIGSGARTIDPTWAQRIRGQADSAPGETLLYSCENLSWIRHADELVALESLFRDAEITALMFIRDPCDFLASYRAMSRVFIGEGANDPDSLWNVDPSTWLVDYEERIDLWREALGAHRFHVFSYEQCVGADGSTIPTVLDVLGIARSTLTRPRDYFLNGRPS